VVVGPEGTKRLTAKEHSEKVKFDTSQILSNYPGNKYKQIYPLAEGESDPYEKFLKKGNEFWQIATGTYK
jgi:hypothetical protein